MNPGNGAAPCAAQRQGFKEIVQSSPAHLPTARTTETRNSGGQPNRTHPGAPTTSTRKTAPALGALGAGFFAECFPGQPRSLPSGPPQGTRHSAGRRCPGCQQGWGRTQPLPAPLRGPPAAPGAPRPPLDSTAGGSRPAHPAQVRAPGRVPRPPHSASGWSPAIATRLPPAHPATSASLPFNFRPCPDLDFGPELSWLLFSPQVLHLTLGKPELFWREGI